MNAEEDAGRFAALFHRVFLRFHRRLRAGAYRLTQESWAVLEHLGASGPLTVAEACRHFDRSQAAMSELFARLERRALIERAADERDRRRTLVWLTKRGLELLDRESRVLSSRLLGHAFLQMAPEVRARLLESLEELLATARADSGYEEEEEP